MPRSKVDGIEVGASVEDLVVFVNMWYVEFIDTVGCLMVLMPVLWAEQVEADMMMSGLENQEVCTRTSILRD